MQGYFVKITILYFLNTNSFSKAEVLCLIYRYEDDKIFSFLGLPVLKN